MQSFTALVKEIISSADTQDGGIPRVQLSEPQTLPSDDSVVDSPGVPLSNADKDWIRQEIQSARRKTGWRRVVAWAKEWGGLGAAATIVVGVLSTAVTVGLFAFSEWKQSTEFRVHTEDRLDKIESDLRDLRASQSPGRVLKEINALDQTKFSSSLPTLRKVMEQPVANVAPTVATLRELAAKLRNTNEQAPDYWPTVLRFIQFASARVSNNVPPPGTPNWTIAFNKGLSFGSLTYKVVKLDGGEIASTRFQNCRIIFTENPVSMSNVTFVNCVFEMPMTDTPSPYLRRISQQLLASNLEEFSITGS